MSKIKIPIMLTVEQTYERVKKVNKNNNVSQHYIREKAKAGEIVCIKSGNKYLINFEKFVEHLNTCTGEVVSTVVTKGQIKPIKV